MKSALHLCPGCGQPQQVYLDSLADWQSGDTGYSIFKCPSCTLMQTLPVPADIAACYGPRYYGNRHGFTARFCASRRIRLIAPFFRQSASRRLLDIGCGDGRFLLAAAGKGWTVCGTELEPLHARANGLSVWATLAEIPPGMTFDCITLWHTLEHMPDFPFVLKHARERLAPGGRLVVAVPDNGGFQARLFKRRWLHLDVPRHLFHFSRSSLFHLLKQADFIPCGTRHQELEYDVLGWSQSLLNVLFKTPNAFFLLLMGKPPAIRPAARALNAVLGALFSVLALPLVWLSSILRRAGTLIVFARRTW